MIKSNDCLSDLNFDSDGEENPWISLNRVASAATLNHYARNNGGGRCTGYITKPMRVPCGCEKYQPPKVKDPTWTALLERGGTGDEILARYSLDVVPSRMGDLVVGLS